ncbi:hypothetical protein [Mycobacterium botniense]|uniref:Uncharacterized protein n=1 Tax=Mycobacterium botniense TaxID=84962 RepID=A0A7I9XZ46_9MYCO|nr:hypothetical protein [Mycobacterium botniense]GFG75078.1 hypothetical protein MBOT_24430 [Mycobacterium botniense]
MTQGRPPAPMKPDRAGPRRGALVLGTLLPAGLGAAVGGAGNRIAGKRIVGKARTAFGSPPACRPAPVRVAPATPRTPLSHHAV